MDVAGKELTLRGSIGIALLEEGSSAGAEELIRDCDIGRYQAKAGGKGRVTVLDQRGRAEARDKLLLVADLRDAIERREISLIYQPIFGAADRVGSLEVGKVADMIVLDEDPLSCDFDRLKDIRVDRTFLGGREVFGSGKQTPTSS